MDLELQWLLLGLPAAFALGWLASRLDLRQWRRDSREAPRAYFKGLNLLLNEQQDKAIDAFIEAVQNDPDTSELHFALGNLFRRRGDFDRAVRVHEHLLQRGDLKPADHARAQRELAQDYMKAGLFDRAEAAWRALDGTPYEAEARLALLMLYERSRDWQQALRIAQQLEAAGQTGLASRIAHYLCGQAGQADAQGDQAGAEQLLHRAQQTAPASPRPWLMRGQRLAAAGAHVQALQAWDKLAEQHPLWFGLVAGAYADSALACGRTDAAAATLQAAYEHTPGMDLLRALARLLPGEAGARLLVHLQRHGHLGAAADLLALPASTWPDGSAEVLQRAVQRAAQPLQRHRCAACGFEAQQHFWQCPGCLSWDSTPPQRIEEQ